MHGHSRAGIRATAFAAGQPCKTGVVDWSCGRAVMIERPDGCYPLRVQPDLAAVSIVGALTNLTSTPPARQSSGSFRSFNIGPHNTSTATQGKDGRRCIRIATAYANLMVWSCPQRFCPFPA